jgi:hypothetical protein
LTRFPSLGYSAIKYSLPRKRGNFGAGVGRFPESLVLEPGFLGDRAAQLSAPPTASETREQGEVSPDKLDCSAGHTWGMRKEGL